MSDLWWCLEMHTIMPAYSFSFCSLSARIAPSHLSYVSQAPVWVQDCVGICCDVTSQCLCLSSLHLPCELAPSPLKSLPFPGPSPPERADKVAFCASPLHRVIILCAGNLFVIGLLPSQMPSSLRAETFHFSWCRAHCCLVAKLCLTLQPHGLYSPPGSSVHGISQTRILEWDFLLQGIFPDQGSSTKQMLNQWAS